MALNTYTLYMGWNSSFIIYHLNGAFNVFCSPVIMITVNLAMYRSPIACNCRLSPCNCHWTWHQSGDLNHHVRCFITFHKFKTLDTASIHVIPWCSMLPVVFVPIKTMGNHHFSWLKLAKSSCLSPINGPFLPWLQGRLRSFFGDLNSVARQPIQGTYNRVQLLETKWPSRL